MNVEELNTKITELNVDTEDRLKIVNINNKYSMIESEVSEYLVSVDGRLENIIKLWNSTEIKSMELTPVGIAIAIANCKRKTGKSFDLSIWINHD